MKIAKNDMVIILSDGDSNDKPNAVQNHSTCARISLWQ
jgi:hypothetical protein